MGRKAARLSQRRRSTGWCVPPRETCWDKMPPRRVGSGSRAIAGRTPPPRAYRSLASAPLLWVSFKFTGTPSALPIFECYIPLLRAPPNVNRAKSQRRWSPMAAAPSARGATDEMTRPCWDRQPRASSSRDHGPAPRGRGAPLDLGPATPPAKSSTSNPACAGLGPRQRAVRRQPAQCGTKALNAPTALGYSPEWFD